MMSALLMRIALDLEQARNFVSLLSLEKRARNALIPRIFVQTDEEECLC